MIAFKKSGEGNYEAFFQKPITTIDRHVGYTLKKEVATIIGANKTISLDFTKVSTIDENGLKMIEQIMNLAGKKKCHLSFKNSNPEIKKILETIML